MIVDTDFGKATFEALHKSFPDGRIPMEVFNIVEKDIRGYMRSRGLRATFRGPRIHNSILNKARYLAAIPSRTLRRDATHVILTYTR